jgi:DNA-binding transcriptional ArsR family regulator
MPRQNATVPKIIVVTGGTPVNVEAASKVFSSTLRMHLIRHYLANPGPQRDAVEKLGVSQRAVSLNTRELVAAGVLIEEPAEDRRFQIYRVDVARVEELLADARTFTLDPDA